MIEVLDVNDHEPVFIDTSPFFKVDEDVGLRETVGEVVALDYDIPGTDNSKVIYYIDITQGNGSGNYSPPPPTRMYFFQYQTNIV